MVTSLWPHLCFSRGLVVVVGGRGTVPSSPESTTNRMPSMVTEVSAMLVDRMHFRTPAGATSNTWGRGGSRSRQELVSATSWVSQACLTQGLIRPPSHPSVCLPRLHGLSHPALSASAPEHFLRHPLNSPHCPQALRPHGCPRPPGSSRAHSKPCPYAPLPRAFLRLPVCSGKAPPTCQRHAS